MSYNYKYTNISYNIYNYQYNNMSLNYDIQLYVLVY